MNVGHLTFSIRSMFLNLSFIKKEKYLPADSLIMFLMLVKGLINSREHGEFLDAKYVAGPVPIDHPKRIILLSLIL